MAGVVGDKAIGASAPSLGLLFVVPDPGLFQPVRLRRARTGLQRCRCLAPHQDMRLCAEVEGACDRLQDGSLTE